MSRRPCSRGAWSDCARQSAHRGLMSTCLNKNLAFAPDSSELAGKQLPGFMTRGLAAPSRNFHFGFLASWKDTPNLSSWTVGIRFVLPATPGRPEQPVLAVRGRGTHLDNLFPMTFL